jgi:hypothetical protein
MNGAKIKKNGYENIFLMMPLSLPDLSSRPFYLTVERLME